MPKKKKSDECPRCGHKLSKVCEACGYAERPEEE